MPTLSAMLEERAWLLADGATGTNLFDMGLESGDPPEAWNVDHPDRIIRLHRMFVDAGSDIILTNTFGCNARRLKLHDLQDRCVELNEAAAKLARAVAEDADRPIVVAGSVGPTGDLFAPLGELTQAEATEVFAEQIGGLKAGGADVIWIETMSSTEEIEAAVAATRRHDMPYCYTASFDTAGRTMMGLKPEDLAGAVTEEGAAPIGIGSNCGVGASDLLVSVLGMQAGEGDAAQPVIIAKANCGIPEIRGDQVVYTGTPELMARYAQMALDAGARIIGGCCGTTGAHLKAMRAALEAHTPSTPPTKDDIVKKIGPLNAPAAKTAEGAAAAGRRRRSRRSRD
ncbi:MAG: betaine--homocysteine S-methyltransferase [Pseudomonadota bacterium]